MQPLDEFVENVRLEFTRRKGPGGQHRNKVETAVIATHVPTGIMAESNGERSQGKNRSIAIFRVRIRLAIEIRSGTSHRTSPADQNAGFDPSDGWKERIRGRRMEINEQHEDFPGILAEALDRIHAQNGDLSKAAEELQVSSSQLTKLLKKENLAWVSMNRLREKNGLRSLK